MVHEVIGRYYIRHPDSKFSLLVTADTYEEALEWCEKTEREDEIYWSSVREEDGTLLHPNGFKYEDPFYEIIDTYSDEVIRKGVC